MPTIYTKPHCVQCKMTKQYLTEHHIAFKEVDVTKDPAIVSHIKQDLGFQATPVIESAIGNWFGFRPDQLKRLAV